MAFWDASAVVPLCFHQPATGVLGRLARRHGKMIVWWGTPVEVRGALARLVREGVMTDDGLRYALARLTLLRRSWDEVLPTEKVRTLAEVMPAQYDLRASDAFQLAAAAVWCRERPQKRPFVCFDQRLADAAERLGFAVVADVTRP